ncbi:hypothetical protein [Corynebacterium sp. LK2510]|uniref:hypothetical protein n=1 Tax=Corynebacterium sp. LK2510 TaxID=3110472 RepID=UPI0034CF4DB0
MKKISFTAAALASALTLSTVAAPHSNAATMTYNPADDTCTVDATASEAKAVSESTPLFFLATFVYEKAVADPDLKPKVDAYIAALEKLDAEGRSWENSENLSRASEELNAAAAEKGLALRPTEELPGTPDPALDLDLGISFLIAFGHTVKNAPYDDKTMDDTSPRTDFKPVYTAFVQEFYNGIPADWKPLTDDKLSAEANAYVQAARPRTEESAKKMDALALACQEKRSAEIDLLPSKPIEERPDTGAGSADSDAATAIGALVGLAAVLGILAAILPLIKQSLPAQIQAMLP